MEQYTTQCPNCNLSSVVRRVGQTRAGAPVYRCLTCGRDAIVHSSRFHPGQSLWLPILEAGVRTTCPTCGLVEEIATIVSQSPSITPDLRRLAQGIATGALIIGTVMLVDAIAKSLERDKT